MKNTSKKRRTSSRSIKKSLEGSFKSRLEVKFNKELNKFRKTHRIEYEKVRLPYTIRRYYVPDFVCQRPDGSIFYIEVKGYLRPADRTKLLAVKECTPMVEIKMVFAQDNKLNSASKTRYSEWCKRNGIDYAIGHIPPQWFKCKTPKRDRLRTSKQDRIASVFGSDQVVSGTPERVGEQDPKDHSS